MQSAQFSGEKKASGKNKDNFSVAYLYLSFKFCLDLYEI